MLRCLELITATAQVGRFWDKVRKMSLSLFGHVSEDLQVERCRQRRRKHKEVCGCDEGGLVGGFQVVTCPKEENCCDLIILN